MKTLTILQQIAPPHFTKPTTWPQIHPSLQTDRRETQFPPLRSWRLHGGVKGLTRIPKGGEPVEGKGNTSTNEKNYNDDKIEDVVWERMIARISFCVGVPLAIGFVLVRVFDVVIENGLSFLTTFITFGASALGIAYGSLSTSLNAAEEGSFLGFEQVQRNWIKMLEAEDGA